MSGKGTRGGQQKVMVRPSRGFNYFEVTMNIVLMRNEKTEKSFADILSNEIGKSLSKHGFNKKFRKHHWVRWNGWRRDWVILNYRKGHSEFVLRYGISLGRKNQKSGWTFTGISINALMGVRNDTCAKHQRAMATAIKRARHLALLPYTSDHSFTPPIAAGIQNAAAAAAAANPAAVPATPAAPAPVQHRRLRN